MSIAHPNPMTAPPFMMLEWVSSSSEGKDYEESFRKYEQVLENRIAFCFIPSAAICKFTATKMAATCRWSPTPVPELDLEIGLNDGWVRFWHRRELLEIPQDFGIGMKCRSVSNRGVLMTLRRQTANLLIAAWLAFTTATTHAVDPNGDAVPAIGAAGNVGCGPNPRRVRRLSIDHAGIYENMLVDGEWTDGTLVKINADGVTLRNCEIRHGRHNAVTVYARDVVIDSCKIHRVLAGTFRDQRDAHGITGRPTNLTIRNCDIGLTSGDCVQFDPGREPWDNVLIENCTLWTAPLSEDMAGFRRGERPGENGVDTKQRSANPRSRLTIRNCLFHGWRQPGQIGNLAALNLKNHIEAHVENCFFRDNEICFRLRGGTGEYGGAQVTIENCAVYQSQVAVRAEDKIRDLKIRRLGVGEGIQTKLDSAGGGPGPGYENTGQFEPPPFEEALKHGLAPQ